MQQRLTDRGGFTLVELLVAITVIGVLVAVLVPALGRAKDQATTVLCRTNLRNLGLGLLAYANDHDSCLPATTKLDNPQTELIAALGKQVDAPRNYYCPAMTDPSLVYSPGNLQAGRIDYFYFSCHQATTDGRVSTFLRWEVTWPRILNLSWPGETWVLSDQWYSAVPTAHRYYSKGVNYLMLNGAVLMVDQSPRQAFH